MRSLNERQRAALRFLVAQETTTRDDLSVFLGVDDVRSATRIAVSLVRRGLATRHPERPTEYRVTDEGKRRQATIEARRAGTVWTVTPEGAEIALRNRAGVIVAHALVDESDLPLVVDLRWHLDKGYAAHSHWDTETGSFRRVRMHRLILNLGPDDPFADHRDLNRLNNRRSNLRIVTRAQNKQNGRKYRSNGRAFSSQYRGVYYRKNRRTWVAIAKVNGVSHYIGSSPDEHEAGRLAAEWRRANMPYSEMDQ